MLRLLGVVTTDTISVSILWSETVQEQVKTAWGVVINNRLYRVKSWQPVPAGTAHPITIDLDLVEGD